MTALILFPVALTLLILGASLAWPVAYRRGHLAGERHAAREAAEVRDVYARIQAVRASHTAAGAYSLGPGRPTLRTRARRWWESTAPRDVTALVVAERERRVIGRPPVELTAVAHVRP